MAEKPRTDQDLLAAFLRDADKTAFPEIVQRHGPMVYRVCQRILADHHESEDAAQVTFAVLAKKAGSIRKCRSLGSWLHGVARMTALYSLRGRIHRRKREEEAAMSHADVDSTPEDRCRESALDLLDEALERLSPRQREAVVLRHLQGRPIAEAAFLAGCPPEVLTSRTRDGLDKLRKFFARRGLAVSGVLLTSLFEAEAQAAVPQTLLPSILAASQSVAAGAAAGTTASGSVVSLTQGVMKMIMLKQAAGLAMVVGTVVAVAVMIAVGAAIVHAGNAEEKVFSAFERGFDSRIVSQGASLTWHNWIEWQNKAQTKHLGDVEIARNLWAEGVAKLKPEYVYTHGVNIVIVRCSKGEDEEGFYVALSIASDDGPHAEQFTPILIANEAPYGAISAFRRRGHFERTQIKNQKEMTPNKPPEVTP